jgi:molecular chaperone Hsp33
MGPRDHLVRAIWREPGIRFVAAFATQAARAARDAHRCAPTSAALLGQGLTAGALLASVLGKERGRVNLQVACDGPAGGMFIDAGTDGSVRGYVKNPGVYFTSDAGESLRPERALGRSGYVNVLRDFGDGEVYRGMVQLTACELAADLDHYFATSEQTDTAVALSVLSARREPLGLVAGVLLQRLPDGDARALEGVRGALRSGALESALAGDPSLNAVAEALGILDPLELLADYPLSLSCNCTRDRAVLAVLTMGIEEMQSLERDQGRAEVTCHFCGKTYRVGGEELRRMIRAAEA